MGKISKKARQTAIDELVEAFYAGEPLPSAALSLMQEWLEDDGWDELLEASGELIYVNLAQLGHYELSDEGLRDYQGLSKRARITDKLRLAHARAFLSEVDLDSHGVNRAIYPVTSSDGRSAVLTGSISIEGQGGPVLAISEVGEMFGNVKEFETEWGKAWFVDIDNLSLLTDEQILAVWNGKALLDQLPGIG